MREIFEEIIRRQQSAGFPDFAGSDIVATVPVSDRLINEVIANALPADGAVREVQLRTEPGNQIAARIALARPAFVPPFTLTFVVERQPAMPDSPVLELRLTQFPALLALGGPILRLFEKLPPGITVEGDRVRVEIRALLQRQQADWLLAYVMELNVTTRAGAIVVHVHATRSG